MFRLAPPPESGAVPGGFEVRRDDSSVQLTSTQDRRCFIRIDTDAPGLLITDLDPGCCFPAATALALECAIGLSDRLGCLSLTVRDIAAGGERQLQLARLRAILGAYGARRRWALQRIELVARDQKADLVAAFSPLPVVSPARR